VSAQRASQLVEAGLWLRLSGDHEGAKRLFEQALKLDPTNARARQLLDSPPPAAPQQPAAPVSNLDWGLATGRSPTPPPVAPLQPPLVKSSTTRPFGESAPPGTHTVRLGEAAAPEIPEVPRFEDPHGEVMITGADDEPPVPDSSTLVFGMSGVPVPPTARSGDVPASGTLVFGGAASRGTEPPPQASSHPQQPGSGTLVFGSEKTTPPTVAPVTQAPAGSGTLVFGNAKEAAAGSGTLVFGSEKAAPPQVPPVAGPGGGTLVFGSVKDGPANSTLVFGAQGGSAPPPIAPVTASPGGKSTTMQFGSSPRELQVATEPGMPAFAIDEEPAPPEHDPLPPPVKSSATLEFNFDDIVPGPLPSPPVPSDPPDAPQTAWDKSNPRIDISQIDAGSQGAGFDLISTPPPAPKPRSPKQLKEEVATLLSGAKDLLDLDDHSGAMELISKALELDPADAAALKLKERSERTLQAMYESKLGDLAQTPRVKLKDDEIIWLNLDHRAGFVLAQIDGSVSFEDLFAVSGMSRLDTARILAQLVEEGVISKG